ncbi:toll-like receptor 1 [Brachyhypopomus gauderio]|uniref:toll-like receptor 1 n=1 Tax=Brachyhypopomus gauderio TaxID=698409 RepID=UPI004042D3E4
MRALGNFTWMLAVFLMSFPTSFLMVWETVVLDYSCRNLSHVPSDIPSSAVSVDLSQNQIQTLKKQDFSGTPSIQFLNLSWNILVDIHPETFISTPFLGELDLSHNRLQNLSNQKYLLKTQNLHNLNLCSNMFGVMVLGSEFSKLTNLKWLGLSADHIQEGDFNSISALLLQTLFIQAQDLKAYEAGSLKHAKAIQISIVVSNNENVDNPMIVDALTSFKEVELSSLYYPKDFLRDLVLQQAEIQTVNLHLSAIQTTWNVITALFNSILMSSIEQLSVFNLTMTQMSFVSTRNHSRVIDSLSVRQSSVTVFIFPQEIIYDFFINIPAKNLTFAECPIVHMTCPKYISPIQVLDLSDCILSENVFSKGPHQECDTFTNLEMLVLRGNNLRNLIQLTLRVQLMSSLRHVDFSQNLLSYEETQGSCVWPSKITHVDLSSNALDQTVFKCLPTNVTILNLQNNQIIAIPANISGLDSLRILDLSANRLLDLPDCLSYPNLEKLVLHGNSLHSPSPGALETCPHLTVLDTSRNPYICTCTLREFTNLIDDKGNLAGSKVWKDRRITLGQWPQGYRCSYPEHWSNRMLQNFTLPEITCRAELLAASILVPAIIVLTTMLFICYQLDVPWYLRMILKWTRAKHRARAAQQQAGELQGVHYHAFVSYSQRNADWVKGQLLPKLEGEDPAAIRKGLRVCHHERDFIPGKTIMQNILRCIEQSRCCVFVLSSHFVQSEWCHYELYFASHHRVTRGLDSILLIVLEPLPPYLIPSKYHQLKAMLARRTYLEWPQDKTKQRMFWAHLQAALQADLPSPLD